MWLASRVNQETERGSAMKDKRLTGKESEKNMFLKFECVVCISELAKNYYLAPS